MAVAVCAVSFLLGKLTTLIEENVNLTIGVKQEIEYVRNELERMIAFLRVADAMEESDAELKVWVKQVRDVAYDTEDIIDKLMILQNQTYNHHGHVLCCFLDKLWLSIGNLKIKYKIASEIKSIQSRVRNIAEGHQRYRYKANVSEQGGSGSSSVVSVGNDRRGDALLLEEWELVGIDDPKRQLISWLVEASPALKVIAVYGMGGLGKTTLVKKVFDDVPVKKHFYSHAWTNVSQTFKIEEILKDLIHQLYEEVKQPLPEGVSTMNANRLKAILREFLRQRRYVLVFDDVWTIQAWEAMKYALPSENHGSRVILTTRLIDVASFSTIENNGYVYELKPLSEDESWILFCRKTFQGKSCPLHLMEISRNILKQCGGLPLAIVAIGGVLATKNKTSIDEWRMLNHSLGVELEGNDRLESMRIILLLSLNDLPYYLKPCFLYLSIYPEDHLIEHNTLSRLWIAEGFVEEKERRTVEEVAEGYLNELNNRSLIQAVKYNDDGSVRLSRIHDIYREIILSKSRDQNLAAIASENNTMWPEKIRRLSIHSKFENAEVKRYSTRLRSLLAFGLIDSPSMSCVLQLLSSCIMLKVLHLRGLPVKTFPEEVLRLFHLRYLSLRDTLVTVLPGSIKKLRQLEVLDLKQTRVTKLPPEILELQHLRHLLVYHTVPYSYLPYDNNRGFEAFDGIGRLRSLQKLSYIEANGASDIFRQIEMLSELRRLSILKLRREQGRDVCSSIEKLHKLHSLFLRSRNEDEILDLQYLSSPPRFLQRVYLTGPLVQLPNWIQSLHSLVKIYLRWSRLREDPLKYLQDLPNLVHLEFLVAFTGETLCFRAGKFEKLKLLDLDKLEELKWVMIEEGAMPHLEKLIVQRCNLLQRVPAGIERLSQLQVLEFFDMPVEFTSTLQLAEDYAKVAHIPQVYYTYWKDGGWEVHPLERNSEDEKSGRANAALRISGRRNSL